MKKQLISIAHLRLLANRILEYCKANTVHTSISVADDGAGNVTVKVTEKTGEA